MNTKSSTWVLVGILSVGVAVAAVSFGMKSLSPQKVATLPERPKQMHTKDVSIPTGASTEMIQNAIDNVSSEGGGTVSFSAGTYTITKPIMLKSNVTLIGKGQDETVLKRHADSNLGAHGVLSTPTSGGVNNVIIKNLTIDANTYIDPEKNSNPSNIMNYGILFQGPNNSNDKLWFENIQIKNATTGLHIKGSTNVTVLKSNFNNNGGSYKYWHNVYLRRVSKVLLKDNVMSHSYTGNGINISYSDHITIQSCQVYDNYFRGIRAANSSYIDVINNNVHGNRTGDGIVLNYESGGVSNFVVYGNTVARNGSYGIYVAKSASNGEVKSNIDGGGNSNGYMQIDGSNIVVQ